MEEATHQPTESTRLLVHKTVFPILFSISLAHFLNDSLQSIIPALYPIMQENYKLTFTQIGYITFVFQLTGSIFQPIVGYVTDKRPLPYAFAFGMFLTLIGLVILTFAVNFTMILIAVGVIGGGSSIFHPESSKVAYYAAGNRRSLAQSIFQLGGNGGSAVGPLLVALIVTPYGQHHILWFLIFAVIGIVVLVFVGGWYKERLHLRQTKKIVEVAKIELSKTKVRFSVLILLILIFSKFFYLVSLTSYYTFYLIHKFHVTTEQSQLYLFVFLAATAAGTMLGGPLGDRFGRKYIIWFSILGVAPFSLVLPHVGLTAVIVLSIFIGVILSSAFSSILVYAQELLPGNIGMVSGLFFGFAFGMGGIGAAVLGKLIDVIGIEPVFQICAFLPLIGMVAGFLPNLHKKTA